MKTKETQPHRLQRPSSLWLLKADNKKADNKLLQYLQWQQRREKPTTDAIFNELASYRRYPNLHTI